MKKLIIFLFFQIEISLMAQSLSIVSNINQYYNSQGGILPKTYNYWTNNYNISQGEELTFCILLKCDSTITHDKIKYIIESLNTTFEEYYYSLLNKGMPKFPICIQNKRDSVFFYIQNLINNGDQNDDFFVYQKLNLELENNIICISGNDIILYKYSRNGNKIKNIIKNTAINISGTVDVKQYHSDTNVIKAQKTDDLITDFVNKHEMSISNNDNNLGSNYIKLNDRIVAELYKNNSDTLAKPKIMSRLRNFLVNFMGNANVIFYDMIPYDEDDPLKKYDFLKTDREQNLTDLKALESYSLYKINETDKIHPEIKTMNFGHWITVKDNLLQEILIGYPSKKYEKDLKTPLEMIFGEAYGKKFYHDICRFFYGFTTALTIQDLDWINEYYYDLAIRIFFPGYSDSRFSNRLKLWGQKEIHERYNALKNKEREIYVTLNDGNSTDSISTTQIAFDFKKWEYLPVISINDSLKNKFLIKPAFLLKIKMHQKWRTIDRKTQINKLNDSAQVSFILLCLNMNRINEWIKSEKHDSMTIFAIGNYLADLRDDMDASEIQDLKKFKELYSFIIKNDSLISIVESSKQSVSHFSLRQIYRKLGDPRRFEKIMSELNEFWYHRLRINVHNRRFLFNICYLKILHQYTYDNNSNELLIENKIENDFLNNFQ